FSLISSVFFLFSPLFPSPTVFYTLSLHDALPIFSKAGFDFLEYDRFDNAIKYINDEIVRLNKKKQPTIEDYAALLNDLNYIHPLDRKSTRLNSSHVSISYAVFCLKRKTVKTHYSI